MPIFRMPNILPGTPVASRAIKAKTPTRSINVIARHEHCCMVCGVVKRCHLDVCGWQPKYDELYIAGTQRDYDQAFITWYVPNAFFKTCYACKQRGARLACPAGLMFRDTLFPTKMALGGLANMLLNQGQLGMKAFLSNDHDHEVRLPEALTLCSRCNVSHGFMWLCRYLFTKIPADDASYHWAQRMLAMMGDMMT